MKNEILETITEKPGASFVDLEHIDGFKGDLTMCITEFGYTAWVDMSSEAISTIQRLVREGTIEMEPCEVITYLIDGKALDLPVVKSARRYKTDRWLPIVFNRVNSVPARK